MAGGLVCQGVPWRTVVERIEYRFAIAARATLAALSIFIREGCWEPEKCCNFKQHTLRKLLLGFLKFCSERL